jgi:hypothetical protein
MTTQKWARTLAPGVCSSGGGLTGLSYFSEAVAAFSENVRGVNVTRRPHILGGRRDRR